MLNNILYYNYQCNWSIFDFYIGLLQIVFLFLNVAVELNAVIFQFILCFSHLITESQDKSRTSATEELQYKFVLRTAILFYFSTVACQAIKSVLEGSNP